MIICGGSASVDARTRLLRTASDTTHDNALSIALHNKLGFQETERVVCFLKHLTRVE